MTIHLKAGLALAVLAALGQANAANALAGLDVTPTVTGSAGAFTYSYDISPTDFNASQIGFTFSDANVTFDSVSGPLNTVIGTPAGSGSFVNYSAKGGTLKAGNTETIVFSSPDGPNGTLGVSGTGIASTSGIGFKKAMRLGAEPIRPARRRFPKLPPRSLWA